MCGPFFVMGTRVAVHTWSKSGIKAVFAAVNLNDHIAAGADDREVHTNASYRSDSGRIKRYVVHRNRATDYSESDVAGAAQSKREGGFY